MVTAFFTAGTGHGIDEEREYLCAACGSGVYYPEICTEMGDARTVPVGGLSNDLQGGAYVQPFDVEA